MGDKTLKRAVACLFVLLYVPYLYQQGYQRAGQYPGDFPTLYWGAKMVFEEGRSPYVEGAFDQIAEREQRRIFPYLYPPPSLLAFYPFAVVTYDAAKQSGEEAGPFEEAVQEIERDRAAG